GPVAPRVLLAVREEVERAAQPVALADVHQEVEGVVGVVARVAGERADPADGEARVAAADEVAPELAYDVAGTVLEGGQRVVDVVAEDDLVAPRGAGQARPRPLQGRPEQLDV